MALVNGQGPVGSTVGDVEEGELRSSQSGHASHKFHIVGRLQACLASIPSQPSLVGRRDLQGSTESNSNHSVNHQVYLELLHHLLL